MIKLTSSSAMICARYSIVTVLLYSIGFILSVQIAILESRQDSQPTFPALEQQRVFADANAQNKSSCASRHCRPCNCDPIGSRITKCDRITGRCPCKPGFTGSKCNQCSLGYYKTQQLVTNGSSGQANEWNCNDCGQCFSRWTKNLSSLKLRSVDLIKRSYDLSYNLTNSFVLPSNETGNGGSANKSVTVDELNLRINAIGGRVLSYKQQSDQMNLMSHELNTTVHEIISYERELISQNSDYIRFESDVERLTYKIRLQGSILNRLTSWTEANYHREQLAAQELLPRGAHKLILDNRQRTRLSLTDCADQRDSLISNLSRATAIDYTKTVDTLRLARRAMEDIGSRIFAQIIDNNALNSTSFDEASILRALMQTNSSSSNSLEATAQLELTKLVADEASQSLDNDTANFDHRAANVQAGKRFIEEARLEIDHTDRIIDEFRLKLTNIFELAQINSTNATDWQDIRVNLVETIEQNTRKLRAELDKVDAQWALQQTELAQLKQTANRTETNQQLEREIDAIISRNQAQLREYLPELDAYRDSKKGLEKLTEEVKKMKHKLAYISDINTQTQQSMIKVKVLTQQNDAELDKTNQIIADLELDSSRLKQTRESNRNHKLETRSMVGNPLMEMKQNVTEQIKRRFVWMKSINHQVRSVSESNSIMNNLIHDLEQRLLELDDHISSVSRDPMSVHMTEDQEARGRIQKLSHRVRVANLINSLGQLSSDIYTALGATTHLKDDFEHHERIFNGQHRILARLHSEMDELNRGIETKVELFHKCPHDER